MRGFKSHKQSQLFLLVHDQMNDLFNFGRHLMRAKDYRMFRERALNERTVISCAEHFYRLLNLS